MSFALSSDALSFPWAASLSAPARGTTRLVASLFLHLAVVRGKSAPWVELVDAREGLISACFWQPALALMFDGSLVIYEAHPGTSKSSWPCRASEGALFKRGQAARCLLCT